MKICLEAIGGVPRSPKIRNLFFLPTCSFSGLVSPQLFFGADYPQKRGKNWPCSTGILSLFMLIFQLKTLLIRKLVTALHSNFLEIIGCYSAYSWNFLTGSKAQQRWNPSPHDLVTVASVGAPWQLHISGYLQVYTSNSYSSETTFLDHIGCFSAYSWNFLTGLEAQERWNPSPHHLVTAGSQGPHGSCI